MGKIVKYILIGLFGFMAVLIAYYFMMADDFAGRMQQKSSRVMAGINVMLQRGEDPREILGLLDQIRPALARGDMGGAEQLLDQALTRLPASAQVDPATVQPQPLPLYLEPEQKAALFGPPVRIQIIGYFGNAADPFLSPDSEYLFFNNERDGRHQTDLFYAKRKEGSNHMFDFIGNVPGVSSSELDVSASLDRHGRFFFSSMRQYNQNFSSLYTGRFTPEGVSGIRRVPGDISLEKPGWMNADVEINIDGDMLYFSRAQFLFGHPWPLQSDLMAAYFADGEYLVHPQNDLLMGAVNTPALEYAPSSTADGLELYFTRASRVRDADGNERDYFRIMVASRDSARQAFAAPYAISSIEGDAEGPYITPDGSALYFHRREGNKFALYRAERRQ